MTRKQTVTGVGAGHAIIASNTHDSSIIAQQDDLQQQLELKQPPVLTNQGQQEIVDLERESFSAPLPLSDDAWFEQMMEEGVNPLVAEGYIRHRLDLNSLLPEHRGEWAAYHGVERLEIGPSKTLLYRKYLKGEKPGHELLVLRIDPGMFPGVGIPATA